MNTPSRPLKVALVSHSDLLGGAAVVTYRLMEALRRHGVDAQMVVYTKLSDDPNVHLIGSRWIRGVKFMLERLRISLANGFNRANLFKVSVANVGLPVHLHPVVRQADIVMLGWVNQGLLSLRGIRKLAALGKPLIWNMHDMWNLTGICHHAYECKAYTGQCGHCQFMSGSSAADLSHAVWLKKYKLYNSIPITFVPVSNWLAKKCRSSSLLHDKDIRVIPNAFPVASFTTEPKSGVLPTTVKTDRKLILIGAARLDDPIKGLEYTIEALNYLFDNNPQLTRECQAVFFGNLKNPHALDDLRFPYTHLGRIDDPLTLRRLYASAKVVLSTSLYETLPGTLIEGQAAGCLPVTFGRGGQHDIVEHLGNGYIAEYRNPRSVAEGIEWALDKNPDRNELHESVYRRFSSDSVVEKYLDLFNELLSRKK